MISVNKQYKSRVSGDAVGDILGALGCASDIKHCNARRSSQEEYSAPVLSGVAVKLSPRAAVRVSAQPASLPPLIQPPVPDDLPRMR